MSLTILEQIKAALSRPYVENEVDDTERVAKFLRSQERVDPPPSERNRSRRAKFFAKTNGHCWYCGVELNPKHWVIEHQNGHNPGHKTPSETLVPACYPCNGRKGKMTLGEYREYMKTGRFYGEL